MWTSWVGRPRRSHPRRRCRLRRRRPVAGVHGRVCPHAATVSHREQRSPGANPCVARSGWAPYRRMKRPTSCTRPPTTLRRATDATDCVTLRNDMATLFGTRKVTIDVQAFESGASAALASCDPRLVDAALEAWTGDLLPDDLYTAWACQPRQRAELLRRELLRRPATCAPRPSAPGSSGRAGRRPWRPGTPDWPGRRCASAAPRIVSDSPTPPVEPGRRRSRPPTG
jgi:hypothetical protein